MRKILAILLVMGMISSICVLWGSVTDLGEYRKESTTLDLKPVYLSNVLLDVRFSNEGPEILVIQYSDINKTSIEKEKPVLVVGNVNATRLLSTFNITSKIVPLNTTGKAALVYREKLILLESGDLGEFLTWAWHVIEHESHWSLGIYSDHSGVLLEAMFSQVEPPKNWSSVGGTLPEYLVSVGITVPGNEDVELSLVPLNGRLFDYRPTTSKGPDFIIHDRSSFFRNTAAWIVENNGDHDVQLRAIIGAESPQLTLQYFLNDVEGSLHVRIGP